MWASAAAMTALAAVGPVAAATGVAGCAVKMKAAAREAASRARTPVLMSRNVLLSTRAPITGGDRRAAGWATSCIHDRQGSHGRPHKLSSRASRGWEKGSGARRGSARSDFDGDTRSAVGGGVLRLSCPVYEIGRLGKLTAACPTLSYAILRISDQ